MNYSDGSDGDGSSRGKYRYYKFNVDTMRLSRVFSKWLYMMANEGSSLYDTIYCIPGPHNIHTLTIQGFSKTHENQPHTKLLSHSL